MILIYTKKFFLKNKHFLHTCYTKKEYHSPEINQLQTRENYLFMCKLLIILGLGMLFSGCATSQKSLKKQMSTKVLPHPVKAPKGSGCHMLRNGYLLCAKTPH
jgi:hypothetical protein